MLGNLHRFQKHGVLWISSSITTYKIVSELFGISDQEYYEGSSEV